MFAGNEGARRRRRRRGATRARGMVAQPATISSAAVAQASCVTRERRERDKMVWFFLEALVALLIAVAIVAWTMGPGAASRRASRRAMRIATRTLNAARAEPKA